MDTEEEKDYSTTAIYVNLVIAGITLLVNGWQSYKHRDFHSECCGHACIDCDMNHSGEESEV